jgi:hypothetical protein
MNAPAQARIPIQLFDNFAPDALQVREAVIAGGFHDEQGPDGALYTGISGYPAPHWYERIAELIGQPIVPKLSCFRLNLAGELPHSFVHSDDICAKYASVLYLNKPEQCKGGTAFWSHDQHGDHLFSDEELKARGLEYAAYHLMMTREWKTILPWTQTEFVPMQFNRFITYPTCFFHSRFPFEAFGSGPEDGRLIWICFYDRRGGDN